MAETVKITVIADANGRIVAAQFPSVEKSADKGEVPEATLATMDGQRAISIKVPREVLQLRGPCLHGFFSKVRVSWPAEVQLPEVEITKQSEE